MNFGIMQKYYRIALNFDLMKNFFLLLIVSSIFITGCEPKPERVVESEWTPEQPKLVTYLIEDGDTKYKEKEEKFYDDGSMEYVGGYDSDGNRHGEWKYYYQNGNLWSLGNYLNGIKTGKKEVYWPTGQLRYEGFFADDQKSGHWVFYDMDGSIINEADY